MTVLVVVLLVIGAVVEELESNGGIYVHTCIYTIMHIYIYVYMYIYTHIYIMYLYMYVIYVYIYYTYLCISVFSFYIYIYIYIYKCIYIKKLLEFKGTIRSSAV